MVKPITKVNFYVLDSGFLVIWSQKTDHNSWILFGYYDYSASAGNPPAPRGSFAERRFLAKTETMAQRFDEFFPSISRFSVHKVPIGDSQRHLPFGFFFLMT